MVGGIITRLRGLDTALSQLTSLQQRHQAFESVISSAKVRALPHKSEDAKIAGQSDYYLPEGLGHCIVAARGIRHCILKVCKVEGHRTGRKMAILSFGMSLLALAQDTR
jgi:hypothetical protein